uniref:Uncharacterized protein n=1 Tax=Anguilla anguilla TaxID=7936 RepID=A0A0E9RIU3_ANGAN
MHIATLQYDVTHKKVTILLFSKQVLDKYFTINPNTTTNVALWR